MKFKDFERKLLRAISATARESLKPLGKEMKDQVENRTRNGIGVDKTNAPASKLKSLKASTIERRRKMRDKGKLSSKTSPSKSNFTATGHTIDKLEDNVSLIKNVVSIEVVDRKDKRKVKENARQGRKWLNLSKTEVDQACRIVEKQFNLVKTKMGL